MSHYSLPPPPLVHVASVRPLFPGFPFSALDSAQLAFCFLFDHECLLSYPFQNFQTESRAHGAGSSLSCVSPGASQGEAPARHGAQPSAELTDRVLR